MSEVKASPRSPALGALSDILRRVRDKGNNVRIPLVDLGIGDMLLGKSPEELEEWAYGNAPITSRRGGTVEQIKGNSNLKPNDEYLPAVQDFIRSQKWDSIGDLRNTGLNRVGDRYFTQTELDEIQANIKHPDYLYLMDNMKPGYKDGGHVELDDDFAYPGMF